MDEINSTDYHDFVFKNGILVGEFDQMYQKSSDVPWHQDKVMDHLDARIARDILSHFSPPGPALEIGCGLGYFANYIRSALRCSSFLATDISITAIEKANKNFPEIQCKFFDITADLSVSTIKNQQFSLVIMRACFWYLFPKLNSVMENLSKLTEKGGIVFVSQNFPPLDQPFVGKEVLPNPQSLIALFETDFELLAKNELNAELLGSGNDNWIMFVARKK